jgi:hippurate hydrolase
MQKLRSAICRVIYAECTASGIEKLLEIKHVRSSPPTTKDSRAVDALLKCFQMCYREEHVLKMNLDATSETFGLLARPYNTPYVYWNIGTADAAFCDEVERMDVLDSLPGNHSS